jgi:hypothetical protein
MSTPSRVVTNSKVLITEKTLVGVAHKPAIERPAIDAIRGRGVLDCRSVEHLSDGVIALLNHREIHQWHSVLLGSVEHK